MPNGVVVSLPVPCSFSLLFISYASNEMIELIDKFRWLIVTETLNTDFASMEKRAVSNGISWDKYAAVKSGTAMKRSELPRGGSPWLCWHLLPAAVAPYLHNVCGTYRSGHIARR